jgi:DNA-binding MarR family transcriptional regulator
MIPSGGVSQNPGTTHITAEELKTHLTRYRLGYAKRGVPTSPAIAAKKRPTLKGWQDLATTDPRRIHGEHNSTELPPFDGVLTPTGRRYGKRGRWVLDVDSPKDLDRLEHALGVELKGISSEVLSPKHDLEGRFQIHFSWPEDGERIPPSVGKQVGDGFGGLDVRGEGSLAMLPPSAGYRFGNDLPTVEAPAELVEWARSRKRKRSASRRTSSPRGARGPRRAAEGKRIPEDVRNVSLFGIGLDLKDQGLSDDEVLEELLGINEGRCDPPLDAGEVEKTARSACRPQYRRKKKIPREAFRIIRTLENRWWSTAWRKVGGKTEASIVRALLTLAKRHGELIPAGVRVSISVRDLALMAGVSFVTVSKATKRLREKGWLRKDDGMRNGTEAGAFVLLARQRFNTRTPPPQEECMSVKRTSRPRVSSLTTRHYRWRGLVNKSRERTLCALEAFGPQTASELAGRLGWSRARDFRLRHLDHLEELGLVVSDDAGVYRVAEDYGTAQDRVLRTPYSVNDGPEASEEERRELDRGRYERQREAYYRQRVCEEAPPEAEPAGEIRELEPVQDPEPIRSEAEVFEIMRAFFGREAA